MLLLPWRRTFATCAFLAAGAAAQAPVPETLPALCERLPGNAAVSLPVRWSHGTVQVRVDAELLPPSLQGRTLVGLRLRRPAFLGEPPYPAAQRTLTVRAAFQPARAAQLGIDLAANRPANLAVVFGPAPVSVAATASPGPGGAVGAELVYVPFATPLAVAPGHLHLELEAGDAPLAVQDGNWVDAYRAPGGADAGYAVPVGDGGCTTRAVPFTLAWTGANPPTRGTDAVLRLAGAPPSTPQAQAPVFAFLGLDPLGRPPAPPVHFGFGAELSAFAPALAGCFQWAPMDALWGGVADAAGGFTITFAMPAAVTFPGQRVAVQGAMLDPGRAGVPASFSNGVVLVLDSAGVGNRCGTVFFPAGAATSPWLPHVGLMPVLVLDT